MAAPHGELLIVEGAGHFPFAEAPEPLLAGADRLAHAHGS